MKHFRLTFFKIGSDLDDFGPAEPWLGPFIFLQLLVSVVIQLWQGRPPGLEWPVLGLAVSHGISFVKNFLFGQEYLSLKLNDIMIHPYRPIVLMHVAIIAGGVFIMKLDSPVVLLCILIFLKTGMDIWLHVKSHRALQKAGLN